MPQFTPTGPFSRQTWKAVENVPGQILGQLGKLGGYLGSPQAAQDYTSLLQGKLPAGARAAEAAGPPVPPGLTNRLDGATPASSGGGRPTPIVQASDDTYKQLLSQYGGAPGIQQLAGMTSLPTGFTPTGASQPASLKDYYAAQTLQGSANLGNIISEMGYKGPMAEWAKANPMLAQREYDKRFGGATLASAVQPTGEVRGMPQAIPGLDTSKMMPTADMQGTAFPGQGQGPAFNPTAFNDQISFGTPANKLPADPMTQGRAVSAPYDQAQAKAAEKTAGLDEAPAFPTTGVVDRFNKFYSTLSPALGKAQVLGGQFQDLQNLFSNY